MFFLTKNIFNYMNQKLKKNKEPMCMEACVYFTYIAFYKEMQQSK